MSSWRHESSFADYLAQDEVEAVRNSPRQPQTIQQRHVVLQTVINSLQQLRPYLAGSETELSWTAQLLDYVQRLQGSEPAKSTEEQFNHMYVLRKWLLWVPTVLLQGQRPQGPAMLAVAYFYATALELEPLFPEIGAECAVMAIKPLEKILQITNTMQMEHGFNRNIQHIATLMEFPRQAAVSFRNRTTVWAQPQLSPQTTPTYQQRSYMDALQFDLENASYGMGNISPAFAPSPLHFQPPQLPSSGSHSPFLEVPSQRSSSYGGFGYNTSEWGAMPSPGFPPTPYNAQDEDVFGYDASLRSGFVAGPPTVWT